MTELSAFRDDGATCAPLPLSVWADWRYSRQPICPAVLGRCAAAVAETCRG